MGLSEDLKSTVSQTFGTRWTVRSESKVPVPEDLGLGNDAIRLEGAVLYADLVDSTQLVDRYPPELSAMIYKSYLHCAAKIIRSAGGAVTAYDGDRIMAVFVGPSKELTAVKAGLQINYARLEFIIPTLKVRHPGCDYAVRHAVGIDTSTLFVARQGIRGANDLVWVGRAANHAAKLAECRRDVATWVTERVYGALPDALRFREGNAVWERHRWPAMGDVDVYGSTWSWAF